MDGSTVDTRSVHGSGVTDRTDRSNFRNVISNRDRLEMIETREKGRSRDDHDDDDDVP